MMERWMPEHVVALAPDAPSAGAAKRLAVPGRWSASGCDDEAVWGLCVGSGAEPYQVAVELEEPAYRCTCPSRKLPCKHGIALLLLWALGQVAVGDLRPLFAAEWLARRSSARAAAAARRESDPDDCPSATETTARTGRTAERPRSPEAAGDRRAAERAARVAAGLAEFDRWLTDGVRTGLAAPNLVRYATWDRVAARLVDAQAPSLANRVRRLAGRVGTAAGWQEHVLAELGVLHLLAAAGARTARLPDALGDGVRSAVGWTVRRDDVLASVPVTDRWQVAGRSDTHEDRLVVRRTWLRGERCGRWAMILSFAAYGQSLDTSLPVGTLLVADVHFYPSAQPLRALVGVVHEPPVADDRPPPASTLEVGCAEVGWALAAEPWLERWPLTLRAAPTIDGARWMLADATGALPVAGEPPGWPALVALSGGRTLPLTAEWTADGLLPVAAHPVGRTVDLGPAGPWGRT
jgi:hypothetical protein